MLSMLKKTFTKQGSSSPYGSFKETNEEATEETEEEMLLRLINENPELAEEYLLGKQQAKQEEVVYGGCTC